MSTYALETNSVIKTYQSDSGPIQAVDDVSLQVYAGEFVALVGPSGSGKTTLVRKVVERLPIAVRGFYTEDVRDAGGMRRGFDICTLDGDRGVLARTGEKGKFRVGRYTVLLDDLERLAIPAIFPAGDGPSSTTERSRSPQRRVAPGRCPPGPGPCRGRS